MIKRAGSIPVDEAAVDEALEKIKRLPGGIEHVSEAVLNQLGQGMEPQDFAALKMDVADYQWLAENRERLEELKEGPAVWNRIRPFP